MIVNETTLLNNTYSSIRDAEIPNLGSFDTEQQKYYLRRSINFLCNSIYNNIQARIQSQLSKHVISMVIGCCERVVFERLFFNQEFGKRRTELGRKMKTISNFPTYKVYIVYEYKYPKMPNIGLNFFEKFTTLYFDSQTVQNRKRVKNIKFKYDIHSYLLYCSFTYESRNFVDGEWILTD